MTRLKLIIALVAVFLSTAESLQIRKTLKLEGDKSSEFAGDKPEVDGERKEVYAFFDNIFGQNEDDIRQEDFSNVQQPDDSEEAYDGMSNLITDAMDGDEEVGSETENATTSKTSTLILVPVNLAHGSKTGDREPWKGESYVDLFGLGLSTSTFSSGAEVTLTRNDLSSKAEGSVRLFLKDRDSNSTCSPVDPTKVINAHCGSHYLFPGYTMRLLSSDNCPWSFRHVAPEIIYTLNGLQLEKDIDFRVEETLVTSSVKMITDGSQRKLVQTKKLLREFAVTTSETERRVNDQLDAEICVPSGPDELLAEYEGFETTCCSKSDSCGVPAEKNIVGKRLTMHALPWEALLAVHGTPTSDTAVTWCSGSLISSEWVLTTDYCFIRNGLLVRDDTDYVPEVIVTFGLENDSLPVETHAVAELHVFPTVTETHEIALVRLREPSSRMPVCLPAFMKPNPARNLINREAFVFGWVVGDGNPYLSLLKQKVISSDECSTQLGRRLPPHMVCSVDAPENRPCLADGDLLTVANNRYFLSGLTWSRLQCVNSLRPHTSVAYFMNWITSVTGMAMPTPVVK